MITATSEAIQHLRDLLAQQPAGVIRGLRLGVEKGGCAGWQYVMKVDSPTPNDAVTEIDGVLLIIDSQSCQRLDGMQLDYVDALNDSGFRILNPNAVRSCGCGTSFETAEPPAPSLA
ncbi:MAG: HesB/IscA family protein [Verrucomicrobiales bacterium]